MSAGGNGASVVPIHCERVQDFRVIDTRLDGHDQDLDALKPIVDGIRDRLGHMPDHNRPGDRATGMTATLLGLADAMTRLHELVEHKFDALSVQFASHASIHPSSPPLGGPDDTLTNFVNPDWALKKIRREQRKSTIYGVAMVIFAFAALVASVAKLFGR
jgi:hypothetical protein